MAISMRAKSCRIMLALLIAGAIVTGCPWRQTGEISVPVLPYPIPGGDGYFLVYELELFDYLLDDLELEQVELIAGRRGAVIRTFTREQLMTIEQDSEAALVLPSDPRPTPEELEATSKIPCPYLLFWLQFDVLEDIPDVITHRLEFVAAGARKTRRTVSSAPIPTRDGPQPVVIAPPLSGAAWMALEAGANWTHHRHGLLTFNGETVISQRYAIDWMEVGVGLRLCTGDGSANDDYPCYGATIYAVADGPVIAVEDGWPDHEHPPERDYDITIENLGGNHVVQDIGGGRYAVYAHCIPGSIVVSEGQNLVAGHPIGALGNSGNSDAPHLHFHIADGPDMLDAQGMPYVFDAFTWWGVFDYFGQDEGCMCDLSGAPYRIPKPLENHAVANGAIIDFTTP